MVSVDSVTIEPDTVTIAENDTATATVGDAYTRLTGGLAITKHFAGPAAGKQGPVTVTVDCAADDIHDSYRSILPVTGPPTSIPALVGSGFGALVLGLAGPRLLRRFR